MLHDTVISMSGVAENFVHTILVVEDEEPIRMILSEYLQDCGYNVLMAGNAAEARRLVVSTAVDLVFSDVNMPGGETGFALEKWIRRDFPHVRVLLTSGYPHNKDLTKDLQEPLLQKPYRCAKLADRLQGILCNTADSRQAVDVRQTVDASA